jgi:hypothetical protein
VSYRCAAPHKVSRAHGRTTYQQYEPGTNVERLLVGHRLTPIAFSLSATAILCWWDSNPRSHLSEVTLHHTTAQLDLGVPHVRIPSKPEVGTGCQGFTRIGTTILTGPCTFVPSPPMKRYSPDSTPAFASRCLMWRWCLHFGHILQFSRRPASVADNTQTSKPKPSVASYPQAGEHYARHNTERERPNNGNVELRPFSVKSNIRAIRSMVPGLVYRAPLGRLPPPSAN